MFVCMYVDWVVKCVACLFSQNGGLNVFMQAFLGEAQAIVRAHVLAIGGNALVSYQLNEIVLLDNPHKHQVSHIQASFI